MSEEKTESRANAIAYHYVGNGDHFVGIPQRDLSKDEFDALTDEQKTAVAKGGVYKKGTR